MWTNVFKIGGHSQISWFQFLPHESDLNPLPDKSIKLEQKDAATLLVLSSHLQLQKEGFLSTWTNSFVGPWDPSQGLHNPDEKIKLWLFLPGRNSSVIESAQHAVSRLRVLASGIWSAPGDSEEVAAALSQALRNRIERAMMGLSYMRFGDVFSKYRPFSQSEELFRRGQPVVEFIFAATEEAIFVHALISAKHVRALSSSDMEKILNHSSNHPGDRLPVIVAPHGMRGSFTGCCPSDLVKQAYLSKTSNGIVGLPSHVSQVSVCQFRGQSCYVEVTFGCPTNGNDNAPQENLNSRKNFAKQCSKESSAVGIGIQKGLQDQISVCERTFIYPVEAVLVPVLQMSFARSSLKRFWLQNWIGPSLSGSSLFMNCSDFNNAADLDSAGGSWIKSNGIRSEHDYHSSSNSNSSSISGISSTSSDSDYKMDTGAGELEADADSLSCRQSGLSSSGQFPNEGLKSGSKRPRPGVVESFGQAGTVTNVHMQDAYKSDYGSVEVNNSAITGVGNDVGSHWDWDDDDRGVMDIQALLSEFGDFGDFFENDALPFGEPPGTAESQALMFSVPDSGDLGGSPLTGMMDVADQMLLPEGFPSFDSFNPPPVTTEESLSKNQEVMKNVVSSAAVSSTLASSTGEFVHLVKAEALMTFAPEYGAVETATSELSTSIFRNPYVPKSRKVDSANSSPKSYVYSATPPSSPGLDGSDEKPGAAANSVACPNRHDSSVILHPKKYYTIVGSGKHENRLPSCNNGTDTHEVVAPSSFSDFKSMSVINSVQKSMTEAAIGAENFLMSMRNVLATEVECLVFQASMCRTRHTLLSSGSRPPMGSILLNQLHGEPSTVTDNVFRKYEGKKNESIPVRIAGDIDGGLLDGPLTPVGVWRPVGVPKIVKPTVSSSMEITPSLPSHTSNEEGMLSYGRRQPLLEFLDGLALLVQQATSLVDVALDAECGDGPYGWLALQEQWRRGFACGPSMVHAGCGGSLASCHLLDIAGVELVDPLLADVHASSVIGLLQSDIKTALRSAFCTLDGPLSVTDWCKGRSQSGDAGNMGDGISTEFIGSECRDPSNVALSVGEPLSPSQPSAVGSLGLKDGARLDDASQRRSNQEGSASESEQQLGLRLRPSLFVLPLPAILVGYQDDWLKTSANSLLLWEKAPLEPYALQKPMTYYVVCPDIDPLTTAAADFFQQLGTVYETCKLGTHSPQSFGSQMDMDNGKWSSSGFVLLDCPQSMKLESSNASLVGSISDYFLSLSNGWDLTSFLKSLSKVLKALKLGTCFMSNPKEGNSGPCMVIYVVCPFPEPVAVLQTVIESSVAIGSNIFSSDKERRCIIHNQVGKALSCSAAGDEASISNVITLSGFSMPKLVLQIVTVDAIFRVTTPALSEPVILKEIAFTVYNKARRISRGVSNEVVQSSSMSNRSHSNLMQISSPIPGMWKDIGPRITGSSLPREGELDPNLRPGAWDTWQQSSRAGGLGCDPHRTGDIILQDEIHYMFEPLFILAEPGSLDHGISAAAFPNLASESLKPQSDDGTSGGFLQTTVSSGSVDATPGSQPDGAEPDGSMSGHQKTLPSIHCCYGWTEDWRWLVCVWTDSRGELLDSQVFPFGGISSRQDTKGLQSLFVQMLHQGCQILQSCSSTDTGVSKPRDFVITRIGCFYELECQEWQKALYSVGGSEVKKWPLQLRRLAPDGMLASSSGASLQEQEMSLIPERTLPSSPSPLYSPHSKASGFIKGALGQPPARKQLIGGASVADHTRGLLQWVQSISFISVSVDHSLHLIFQADSTSPGGSQGSSTMNLPGYLEGFTPVRSLGTASASYILIPSPSMRFLPPSPLQLPTCLTAESPPLAHLLHSKGSAVPVSTGFVVSKAASSMRQGSRSNSKEEWPSVLAVSLVDYYGGNNITQEKIIKGIAKQGGRGFSSDARDFEIETHLILESLAAELHALSWMTVSPAYLERRSALPCHCDMVLRLRRLLHFADKELSRRTEK
ncbi:mediator of RNA polymerase II transcription subunit 13 [Diospyros lotus]|uniref:mediator of RNA polymerase II transcription subunit 13 n=1 Tax=Diospyros lotus TaxID=55363 RepID=UPI0022519BF7|nr:mediator of RNA polymerase II transcription subunit 13 [Diospyros lotus]XP_052190236.1 mediator of RNA polymerase II transcription subunit 13 [Diospyros lotus]